MEACAYHAKEDDRLVVRLPAQTARTEPPIVIPARIAVLLLSAVLAIGAVAGTWAAPLPSGLDAPIRAFAWPVDSPPNDPGFLQQTDLEPIGVAAAWTRTTGLPGVVVAVLDTGIDAPNPEFAGRLVPGFNALTGVEDSAGDFGPTTDDSTSGHGTHVSGTIAAAADNGTGIAGIAPNVSIMPIKILDSKGQGDFGGLIDGMNWAIAHGARIITMSLGGPLAPGTVADVQFAFDTAHAAGAIVMAAAGNDGIVLDEFPCNFVHVICVGSTTKDGTAVSSFSTRTVALALVAPGERIYSTIPADRNAYLSGTSMATSHVTGAVALLRSVRPTITPDEVLAALTLTARPIVAGGRDPASGYGLLQVAAAVDRVMSGVVSVFAPLPPTPPSASPMTDPVAPAVTASSPRNGTRSVARSTRPRIAFSLAMAGISTRTIRMKDLSRGRWVTFRVSYSVSTRTVTIIPTTRLAANHSYRVYVDGVVSASDGTAMSRSFIVTFRTGYR